ncbi:MAG: hypothetical protein ACWGSD_03840 [Thermodesulfobacteriota bacterium]
MKRQGARMAIRYRKYASLLLAAGVTIYACSDLDVLNLNEPDRDRVLNSFDDAVALISGSFNQWYHGVFDYGGPGLFLSQAAFQHTSPWACSTEQYSRIPRMAIQNDATDVYYGSISKVWIKSYAAITAAADGMRALSDQDLEAEGSDEEVARALSFGRFSLGMSHATVALLYDQGFRIDENVDPESGLEPMEYAALMDLALGDFDEVIELVAAGPRFSLPYGWMQAEVTSEDLARLAHSYKARFRAQVARTPEERAAVEWNAVLADVDAGLQGDHLMEMDWDAGWYNAILDYSTWPSWHNLNYFISGMADQSGHYQEWLQVPFYEKTHLLPDGRPVLIVTPDLRFPQGETVSAQRAESGRYFRIASIGPSIPLHRSKNTSPGTSRSSSLKNCGCKYARTILCPTSTLPGLDSESTIYPTPAFSSFSRQFGGSSLSITARLCIPYLASSSMQYGSRFA